MPLSDSSASKPTLSTKSRRTGSCRSFFQSIFTALGMCPLSYALVSSSTSTMTVPGVLMCASTQSASTRTSDRLMSENPPCTAASGGRTDPLDKQVHVATEAEVEGRVEERGCQGERGEDDPHDRDPGREADRADPGEHHAHALGEAGRGLRLGLRRRPEAAPRPGRGDK